METLPPTYAAATSRDYWSLIAPHIPSSDLCSCSLVCKRWHQIFVQELWGNPASHFSPPPTLDVRASGSVSGLDLGDDLIYTALVRFKRTLRHARIQVRELTHTLRLPPAHPELYEGPRSDWLKEILEWLPRLQSLIVRGLPFWDHAALMALRTPLDTRNNLENVQTFNLRYLDAAHCTNSTPSGLAEALRHFPALLYLDLSGVQAVRVPSVLQAMSTLPSLQILKLRSLGLKDVDIEIITKLGKMLRSLDVTDNALTDSAVRILLDKCFKRGRLQISNDMTFRPIGLSRYHSEENELEDFLDDYRGMELDRRVRRKLTTGLVDNIAIEMDINAGLTHLYISGNSLSVEGVAALLRSGRLQILDCGDIAVIPPGSCVHHDLPGVSKLIPLINNNCSPGLSYLRINHALATTEYQPPPEKSTRAELPGNFAFQSVDTGPPVYGLEGTPISRATLPLARRPVELEGDSTFKMTVRKTTERPPLFPRGASDTAPEPIDSSPSAEVNLDLLKELNNARQRERAMSAADADVLLAGSTTHRTVQQVPITPPIHLTPLPGLKTLVLTSVPATVADQKPIANFINLLYSCSSATNQTSLRAASAYGQTAGKSIGGAISARHHYTKQPFQLEKIVLEMQSYVPAHRAKNGWRKTSHLGAMEDADVDALWQSASGDFSFFDNDEECGLPSTDRTEQKDKMDERNMLTSPILLQIEQGRTQQLDTPSQTLAYELDGGDVSALRRLEHTAADPTPPSASDKSVGLSEFQRQSTPLPSGVLARRHGGHKTTSQGNGYGPQPSISVEGSASLIQSKHDLVAQIAAFRRERKVAFETALATATESQSAGASKRNPCASDTIFVAGYWAGEIQVIR